MPLTGGWQICQETIEKQLLAKKNGKKDSDGQTNMNIEL